MELSPFYEAREQLLTTSPGEPLGMVSSGGKGRFMVPKWRAVLRGGGVGRGMWEREGRVLSWGLVGVSQRDWINSASGDGAIFRQEEFRL